MRLFYGWSQGNHRATGMYAIFMRICGIIVVSVVMLLGGLQAFADSAPRPDGLEPEIAFWRTVFTEVSSQQALIHDNRQLAIVYEKVELTNGSNGSQKRRTSEKSRNKYRKILKTLAERRAGLTSEQRRVLALWPEDVTDAELRAAADRVRFQQGLSDRFRDGLIRSGRWREHILDSLEAEGVPTALASLPHVESSYNPVARSFVGASGLWQFTRSTGRRFMQIDHVIDERRDPYLSSAAAAQLLSYNYSILKSWPLAITAYNHGVAGMRRAVRQTGTDDIETIIREYDGRAFGFASRNFYVAFLAAHDVDQNVEKYFGSGHAGTAECRYCVFGAGLYVCGDVGTGIRYFPRYAEKLQPRFAGFHMGRHEVCPT